MESDQKAATGRRVGGLFRTWLALSFSPVWVLKLRPNTFNAYFCAQEAQMSINITSARVTSVTRLNANNRPFEHSMHTGLRRCVRISDHEGDVRTDDRLPVAEGVRISSLQTSKNKRGVRISGRQRGVRISGERHGVRISGHARGVRISGQERGVRISGHHRGVRISGHEGVRISGQERGVRISGHHRGVRISGRAHGVRISGTGEGAPMTAAAA